MNEVERAEQVVLAEAGSADALQRLLLEYHEFLLQFISGSIEPALRHRIEPDDVLQDAYVAAFRALAAASRALPSNAAPTPGETPASSDESERLPPGPQQFATPAGFYKWLERIALNQLRDAQRAMRRKKRDIARHTELPTPGHLTATSYPDLLGYLTAPGTSPSRVVARHEAAATVMTCLARLSADQRTVVRLRFLQDVPVAEIARRLAKSETAVYALCHRGLKSLRDLLIPLTQTRPAP